MLDAASNRLEETMIEDGNPVRLTLYHPAPTRTSYLAAVRNGHGVWRRIIQHEISSYFQIRHYVIG